ncbi:cardiolipin synthase [Janthinobacterium sp. 17J80-10]|uniref:cardiolipin synthase n=1 Tax=Janthinobacterium sp. 17J80-10 TaxID=2497863 RepID=UPI00100570C4|nr:cardiolipin synthase [Janthinobacterium sp. 17J80-10]QAU33479.1 cardiolipin synthase [Janthinobacterium sp. 17J80-10]
MLLILASVLATLIVGLIVINFTLGEKKVTRDIPHRYTVNDAQFRRTMGVMLGPTIVAGNRIDTLLNGDQIFPAMLQAIRAAEHTITFETFIYWSGEVGKEFAEALAERARAGVKVHVLLDWVGSNKMEDNQIDAMRQAGVEILKYRPLRWYNISRINNRTHRKLLVIDGKIGFTGGVGIADKWRGKAQDPDHWRDSHFRIEGPVVAQMQAVALDNWMKTTGKVLHGAEYFPALQPAGDSPAQMFSSSPSGGSESMELMYLLAITAAKKSIYLSSAYFVPDELVLQALVAAVERGVKVQVIVPGKHIDTDTVRRASRGQWGDLLKAGVEIFEYQPTMFHCKVMVVDELLVSVGSTNFDDRSFRLNDEANLNVYSEEFAQHKIAIFQQDLQQSRRITLEQWQSRPLLEKLLEHTLALAAPLL